MRPRLIPRKHRRRVRLHSYHFHMGILFLKIASCSRNRPASADARNKHINITVSITPNLRTRRLIMGLRIRSIRELVRHKGIFNLRKEFPGFFYRTGNTFCPISEHDLSTVCFHQAAPFHRHSVRHNKDDLVSFGAPYCRKGNTGIARCWLNDSRTGFELPFTFSSFDHIKGSPVFYGTGQVESFNFAVNPGLKAQIRFKTGKFEKRCIPNQLDIRCFYRCIMRIRGGHNSSNIFNVCIGFLLWIIDGIPS